MTRNIARHLLLAGASALLWTLPLDADPLPLQFGQAITRELSSGDSHSYRVNLQHGQYAKIAIVPRGIQIRVTLTGGSQVIANASGLHGGEESIAVRILSGPDDIYQLDVRPSTSGAAPGQYQIRIEELRPATPEDRLRLEAWRSFEKGKDLLEQGTKESLAQAAVAFKTALPQWRDVHEPRAEAETLHNLGLCYAKLSDNQNASEYLNQALALRRNTLDQRGEAETLTDLAEAYYGLDRVKEALQLLDLALPLREATSDVRGQAITLNDLAVMAGDLGDPRKALGYLARALPLRRTAGDRQGEAKTLSNIGNAHEALGEYEQALEYYGEALRLAQSLHDTYTEAAATNNLGAVYSYLGEKQTALHYYHSALSLEREIGDRDGEGRTLNNLGRVYDALGDRDKALFYLRESLAFRRATHDARGEAVTLNNMASIYADLGQNHKALELCEQALEIERGAQDKGWEGVTLNHMGWSYAALGEQAKALQSYTGALTLLEAAGARRYQIGNLNSTGRYYEALHDNQRALQYHQRALEIATAIGDRPALAATYYRLSVVHRKVGHWKESQDFIEKALLQVESLRAGIQNPDLQASYFGSVQDYFRSYIDLLMQLSKITPAGAWDSLALETSERARTRSLLDMLAEARIDIRKGVDPGLVNRRRAAAQKINSINERLTRSVSDSLNTQLNNAEAEFQEIDTRLRESSAQYASLQKPEPVTLKQIQSQILDPSAILLEYARGETRTYLFVVSPAYLRTFDLGPSAAIDQAARHYYELLSARNTVIKDEAPQVRASRIAQADQQSRVAGLALGKTLLGPAASLLKNRRLVFVAEGALQYVPFGALSISAVSTGYVPLIATHEVVCVPSVSVLAELRRESRRPAPPRMIAVLADPVFARDDPRIVAGAPDPPSRASAAPRGAEPPTEADPDAFERSTAAGLPTRDLPRLPFTRQEAEAIRALVPASLRMEALDFQASRARALSPDLAQYRVVHFATHGLLNTRHPELSGLVMSLYDEQGHPQDGYLKLQDIYNMTLSADLVVLSACQTGLGKEIKGEGLVGLTRGFMYAGAPRVAASLWKVDDVATAELMRRFYQGIFTRALTPAAALQQAQSALAASPRWSAPYYWAAFQLHGEWK